MNNALEHFSSTAQERFYSVFSVGYQQVLSNEVINYVNPFLLRSCRQGFVEVEINEKSFSMVLCVLQFLQYLANTALKSDYPWC